MAIAEGTVNFDGEISRFFVEFHIAIHLFRFHMEPNQGFWCLFQGVLVLVGFCGQGFAEL